jgi:hypothetical protein
MLRLVIDNKAPVKGRMTKRKKEFTGMKLVINEPMGFCFMQARKDSAERKRRQENSVARKNKQIANNLAKR